MWTRAMLKERAKVAFKRNYWSCVLVALILMIVTGGAASTASSNAGRQMTEQAGITSQGNPAEDFINSLTAASNDMGISVEAFVLIFMAIFSVAVIIVELLRIFVFSPMEIGGCRFFVENANDTPGVGKILYAFKSGAYGKMVLTLFLRDLFIALWSLLFVIPGIIKAYEYRMVPYLLADCPEMSRQDAFRISKEMMTGQKWNAFVLDLSFIGWELLAGITCGIAGIFYVAPYVYATDAEMFLVLRENYFQSRNTQQVF
ncbi:DUF975 family protein [Sporofaciens sp. SGI.106]|uniref:DUF975 family protein n=1 Tax=Sporofaciens sp. SGI.106 TaxID=3420568 RepID=UPI003D06D9DE